MDPGHYTLEVLKQAPWYNNWLLANFTKYLRGQILDVGAGIGNFSEILEDFGTVTAIDPNRKYIRIMKKKNIRAGLGDIETGKYFFKSKKFDSIVCLNVIEHIGDDNAALSNMYKLLRKNGKLILLTPAHKVLTSKFDKKLGHNRRYSKRGMMGKVKKAGFRKISIKYVNWVSAIGWFVFLKLTRDKKMPKNKVKIFDKIGRVLLWPEKFIEPPFGLSVLVIAEK